MSRASVSYTHLDVYKRQVYGFIASYVILLIIDKTMGLRVTEEQEREGLDISLHGESIE